MKNNIRINFDFPFSYSLLILYEYPYFLKFINPNGVINMIVKGPILVPNIPDKAGDVLDEETIRKAVLIILRNNVLIDVQHSLMNIGKLLELYVTDSPVDWMGATLPKGTALCSIDVTNTEVQQAIKDGKYTGLSILAAPVKTVAEMDRRLN